MQQKTTRNCDGLTPSVIAARLAHCSSFAAVPRRCSSLLRAWSATAASSFADSTRICCSAAAEALSATLRPRESAEMEQRQAQLTRVVPSNTCQALPRDSSEEAESGGGNAASRRRPCAPAL